MRMARWMIGEFFGTFLLVFFGCGSVSVAVTTGAHLGLFEVAVVWGLGIATAIYRLLQSGAGFGSARVFRAGRLGPGVVSSERDRLDDRLSGRTGSWRPAGWSDLPAALPQRLRGLSPCSRRGHP